MFKKVIVGMSGGVDSAVAALLLKNKGYTVLGAFMKNWDILDETGVCTSERDYEDATWVCDKLNIPLVEINFVKEYWGEVFSHLIEKYEAGYTPNPDILCNKNIKFNRFLDIARKQYQADAIATGHYAKTNFGPYLEHFNTNVTPQLLVADDPSKDQTFFLSQIPLNALRYCMFPLGNYKKYNVKQIALEAGFDRIVKKRESMGMCFIGKRDFKSFIKEYVDDKPGNFIDFDTGQIVGVHTGIHQWTVGQRCRFGGKHDRYYILRKNVKTNDIIVVSGDHPALFSDYLEAHQPHWLSHEIEEFSRKSYVFDCSFRFQHRKPLVPCSVFQTKNNKLLVRLGMALRAVTLGQFAVFYFGNKCLGSAEIIYTGPSCALTRTESLKEREDTCIASIVG